MLEGTRPQRPARCRCSKQIGIGVAMAREVPNRDIEPTLLAARQWINQCLVEDGSLFSPGSLWTLSHVEEVSRAFVDHPDFGNDDFLTKLKGQMAGTSANAQRLMSEMLWALLLFPATM